MLIFACALLNIPFICFLVFITLYCSFCKERQPALIPSRMHDWTWSDWLLEANKFFFQPFRHTQTHILNTYICSLLMYEVVIFHYRISQNYEAHPIAAEKWFSLWNWIYISIQYAYAYIYSNGNPNGTDVCQSVCALGICCLLHNNWIIIERI